MHIYFCVGTLLFDSLRQGAVKCQATQDIDKRHIRRRAQTRRGYIGHPYAGSISIKSIMYIGLSGGRFEITYDILNSMVMLANFSLR